MKLIEPYEKRRVRCIDLWDIDDWRLKVYGITYAGSAPRADLVEAARMQASEAYPTPAITENRYGRGFVGVHDGRGADFLFYCWWENENELGHRVFAGPKSSLPELPEQNGAQIRACTWDVTVIAHERDAWVRHVLANPLGPDLDAYLEDQLDALL